MKTPASFRLRGLFCLLGVLLLLSCSGSRYLKVEDIEKNQSVRLFLKNGEVKEGIVVEQNENELTIIDAGDHEPLKLPHLEIRNIEVSQNNFDYNAYPISAAEIAKYKKSRNTWAYAIGGGAVGAGIGLAIAVPIWLSNDNPPPLFGAGLGLILGSIYFGSKGIKKDRQVAIQHVRELRSLDSQLAQEKAAEEEKLKALEKEKEELLKQLDKKKKNGQEDPGSQNE